MFDIREHLEFDSKGRASCPNCSLEGKEKQKNLSVLQTGAYKCHRGCSPQAIRAAIGAEKPAALPPQTMPAGRTPSMLVNPARVKTATETLLKKATHCLNWLTNRGISAEMIEAYRLGAVRAKVGSRHLPAIAISIPNADGTAYYHKKRIAPWLPPEARPDGYSPWSQYGIPQMVFITHSPEAPEVTWLCEGEWDAIVLGWAVRHSELKNNVQVACFTCGAGNIPPDSELDRLSEQIAVFYDLDEPGQKGAKKLQDKLKQRVRLATVPHVGTAPIGWDVSDAINAGLFDRFPAAAAAATAAAAAAADNPLKARLISNDELLARAPDYTDWLVDDILTADELFLLAAAPRAGKSLLALTLAHAVATGGKFLERPVAQGAVLYIRCEDSETKTKERELKQGWAEGLPVYWLDKFKLSELAHLEQLIEELGCRLVVFDTLSRIRDASISESSAEMSQLLEPIQEMCKKHRCCGLLVHHTGKVSISNAGDVDVFDTIRGSSAIRATCRGSLIIAADERSFRLCVENGWGRFDLKVLLDANTLQWRLLGNWVGPEVEMSQKDVILDYLTQVGAAGVDAIAAATNLPKRSVYVVLKRLQCDELIEKRGERQQAVYVKSAIQQIQQLNNLLNSPDPRPDCDRGSSKQNIFCVSEGEKSDHFAESDQENDHFSNSTPPPTTGKLLNKSPEPLPDKAFGIQQQFNNNSTRGAVEFNTGDKVAIIKPGSLMGQICQVKTHRADFVVVQKDGWVMTREYYPDELELIERGAADDE